MGVNGSNLGLKKVEKLIMLGLEIRQLGLKVKM